MSDHTQGQWSIQDNTEWGWKSNPFSITVKKHGVHRTTVANIPTRKSINIDEAKANAFMISAAPELLAQLEFAVKLLKPLAHTAQVQKMVDVISKAKGEAK